MLTEKEKAELRNLTKSAQLREDMRRLSRARHNPFIVNGDVDIDRLLSFLTEYNCFINHTPRPFRRIINKDMRL